MKPIRVDSHMKIYNQKGSCWEAAWGRISTLDMLQRRGVPLVNRSFWVNSVRSRQIIFYSIVV